MLCAVHVLAPNVCLPRKGIVGQILKGLTAPGQQLCFLMSCLLVVVWDCCIPLLFKGILHAEEALHCLARDDAGTDVLVICTCPWHSTRRATPGDGL